MKRACVWRVLFRLLPIVSSEWGYSTAEGAVSEARQADYLSRQARRTGAAPATVLRIFR